MVKYKYKRQFIFPKVLPLVSRTYLLRNSVSPCIPEMFELPTHDYVICSSEFCIFPESPLEGT